MGIKDIDERDRPREKLLSRGVKVLSNEELLQVIIGSGVKGHDVVSISKDITKLLEEKSGCIDMNDLRDIKGISTATASKLVASLEVASRFIVSGTRISDINDVAMVLLDIRKNPQEHFILLTLDGANNLINRHTISIGTLNASMVHPRDVFSRALSDNAGSIVVAHNHPSGSTEPSEADLEVTRRLKEAGKIIGINLRHHIILTKDEVVEII